MPIIQLKLVEHHEWLISLEVLLHLGRLSRDLQKILTSNKNLFVWFEE